MDKREMLAKQYEVLGHKDGDFTEIRIIREGKSYYCRSKEEFVNEATKHLESDSYVGINPRSYANGTGDSVLSVSCLVVDIDPIRPKGEGSTPEQHEAALDLGKRISDDLKGVQVSSGSGCHVYLPINSILIRNRVPLADSLRKWNKAIKEQYETKDLKIDSIFDFPRVIRLWGSFNTKSQRVCGPIGEVDSTFRHDYSFSQEEEVKPEFKYSGEGSERFTRLVKTNKRLSEILQGNIKYPSRSESDFEFIAILAKAHFTFEEIKNLVLLNPTGRREECEDRDIRNICKKIEMPTNAFSMGNSATRYYDSLKKRTMGISTGIRGLDEMVSGFKKQKLYIFAARPTEGKTSLITQVLTHVAEQGHTCLFFPTEVGAEPIIDKIVSSKTELNLKKFQNGSFLEDDYVKIEGVRTAVSKLPLIIIEDFGLDVSKIEEGIKQYAPAVVAIDFFQALRWSDKESVAEKSDAVRKLKELAGDFNIPIIVASQLNRSDGKADLRQLKGTGTLEELGDVIAFLFTESKLNYPRHVILDIQKSKYSAVGQIQMNFFSSTCKFVEIEEKF